MRTGSGSKTAGVQIPALPLTRHDLGQTAQLHGASASPSGISDNHRIKLMGLLRELNGPIPGKPGGSLLGAVAPLLCSTMRRVQAEGAATFRKPSLAPVSLRLPREGTFPNSSTWMGAFVQFLTRFALVSSGLALE